MGTEAPGAWGLQDEALSEARCRYGWMVYPSGDRILGRSLQEYGEWAQREVELLCGLIEPGAVVLDVGAFIGTHTLALAQAAGGAVSVHAFEPHPAYFELLRRNVERNGLRNVQLHEMALGAGTQTLAVQRVMPQAQVNFGHMELKPGGAGQGEEAVAVAALDGLGLARCDLIKIDAEGMEAEVLHGAQRTLESSRALVYCECNSAQQGWLTVSWMQALGYETWLHCFAAFNADNYRGSGENIFGLAREVGLLFVPAERAGPVAERVQGWADLARVQTLDDLVLGLLRKPQYKTEVLDGTAAAQVFGDGFWLNEAEAQRLRQIEGEHADVQARFAGVEALALERAAQLEALSQRLDLTQAALEQTQQLACERGQTIDELRRRWRLSRLWRWH